MSTTHPLGNGMIGQVRLGDELASNLRPLTTAIPVTYTITFSKYAEAVGVTYTIQAPNTAIMQVYYVVAPPQHFAINSDATIIAPDQVQYNPRSVLARSLLATPLLQGYETMIWTYTVLQEHEAQHLLSFYNPLSPQVLLTYPDDNGVWVQRTASMLPPNEGQRETVTISGLTLTFLLLPRGS